MAHARVCISLSALPPVSAAVPGPLSAAGSIGLVQALRVVPDPRGRRGASSRSAVGAAAGAAGGYGRRLVVDRYRAVGATAPQALGVYEESPLATTFVRVLV